MKSALSFLSWVFLAMTTVAGDLPSGLPLAPPLGPKVGPPVVKSHIVVKEILTIGRDKSAAFSQVGDIAVDGEGNIYATDRYQYKLKKFSSEGKLMGEFGRQGREQAAFESGPGFLAVGENLVTVSDLTTDRVLTMTHRLGLLYDLRTPGPASSLAPWSGDRFVCAVLPLGGSRDEILGLYNRENRLRNIHLDGVPDATTLRMVHVRIDRSNRLIVAYQFLNAVMVYDTLGNLLSSFRVPGLPDAAAADTLERGSMGVIPRGDLIKSIAAYADSLIFVLGGEYAEHPFRDIRVVDYRGNLREVLTLPSETGLIYVDSKGFLYTREESRTLIRKYAIRHSSTVQGQERASR